MNQESNNTNEKDKLEEFRKEILEIAKKEAEEKKTAHFQNTTLDSGTLNSDDMQIWTKVTDGTIATKDFEEYRKSFKNVYKEKPDSMRLGFLSLAGNRAQVMIWKRESEERRKNKKQ